MGFKRESGDSQAFNQGCDARCRGEPHTSNPYFSANRTLHGAWDRGWIDADIHYGRPQWMGAAPPWWKWWSPKIVPLPQVKDLAHEKNGKVAS